MPATARPLSADGRILALLSEADDLVPGDAVRAAARRGIRYASSEEAARLRIRETKGFDHREGQAKRRDLEAMGFVVEIVS